MDCELGVSFLNADTTGSHARRSAGEAQRAGLKARAQWLHGSRDEPRRAQRTRQRQARGLSQMYGCSTANCFCASIEPDTHLGGAAARGRHLEPANLLQQQ